MAALSNEQLGEAVYRLLHASTEAEAAKLLQASPWLMSAGVYLKLTQVIANKHRAGDWQPMADFMACRGLLRRCRLQGREQALAAQPGWPLSTQGPLAQLLLALVDKLPADVRLKQASLALADVEPASEPDIFGFIHYNLGLSYQTQAEAGSPQPVDEAIGHFETALQAWAKNVWLFGQKFAGQAQSNLGRLYMQRGHGQRSQDIETALAWFKQAQETFGAESPELLDVFILMGDAYLNRITGERLDNIEQGIHYYRQARQLAEQKNEGDRLGHIEHNLAVAYRVRLRGQRADNYEQAKDYAASALNRFNRQTAPEDWARTAGELATIYAHRQQGERNHNLETAIEYAQQALTVYQADAHPRQWALAQLTLGNLYCDRLDGERAENEQKAVCCFEAVAEKAGRTTDPLRWAEAMNNLGTVYVGQSRRYDDAAYRQAVHCFQQALEIRRLEALPAQARQTAANWGYLAFHFERWAEAQTAFETALAAGESLYQRSSTEAGRRVEVAESSGLAANIAFCLLKQQQPEAAFLQLEQGKTRLLAEALARDNVDLAGLPAAQRQAIQEAREKVRSLEAQMRLLPEMADRPHDLDLSQHLSQVQAELKQQVEIIRQDHPDFMPAGLKLPELLALIPPDGALVAPLVTARGSAVFVLPYNTKKIESKHVILLETFTRDKLNGLLLGRPGQPGWLRAYLAWREGGALSEWLMALVVLTGQLWDALMGPIYDRLHSLSLTAGAPVLLLPQGGLGLLPLHAAWRNGDGDKRALLDDYQVTYVPSGYALSISQGRLQDKKRRQRSLLAVVNPTQDLAYTPIEGEQVVKLFGQDISRSLTGDEAASTAVTPAVGGRSYLHFSCHGFYDWDDAMRSGLVLAGGQPLTLADIISQFNLDAARLVVLSACETGLTEFQQSPDEYIGLPAGFLQAGAPGVVSTLWAVNDLSTMLLMERFYENHLRGGLEIAEALRQAQLWLRDVTAGELAKRFTSEREAIISSTRMSAEVVSEQFRRFVMLALDERPFAHPFYWAAFTFSGA